MCSSDPNLLAAEITAVNGELATVRIGPVTRELPHRGLAPGPAHVALRPETIRLVAERREDAIAGEVLKTTYLGSHMEYTVGTALAELFVVDPQVDRALPPGTPVSVIPGARGITLVRD